MLTWTRGRAHGSEFRKSRPLQYEAIRRRCRLWTNQAPRQQSRQPSSPALGPRGDIVSHQNYFPTPANTSRTFGALNCAARWECGRSGSGDYPPGETGAGKQAGHDHSDNQLPLVAEYRPSDVPFNIVDCAGSLGHGMRSIAPARAFSASSWSALPKCIRWPLSSRCYGRKPAECMQALYENVRFSMVPLLPDRGNCL
jgi:hypothetical protein